MLQIEIDPNEPQRWTGPADRRYITDRRRNPERRRSNIIAAIFSPKEEAKDQEQRTA